MDFIPVVVIVGVVCFLAWKNKDKILAPFKKPETGANVPIPSKPIAPTETTEQAVLLKPRDSSYALPTQDNITDRLFRPNAEQGAILDSRVGNGETVTRQVEAVPMFWESRDFLVQLSAGVVYTIRAPEGRGYMVAGGEGGQDSLFNGVVGGTMVKADASGIIQLVSSKTCQAYLSPL